MAEDNIFDRGAKASPASTDIAYIAAPGGAGQPDGFIAISDLVDLGIASLNLTDGSVVFAESGQLSQDNANIFWNNTLKRLGLGTSSPQVTLDIRTADKKILELRGSHDDGVFFTLEPTAMGGEDWAVVATADASPIGGGHLRLLNLITDQDLTILNTGEVIVSGLQVRGPTSTEFLEFQHNAAESVYEFTTQQAGGDPGDNIELHNTGLSTKPGEAVFISQFDGPAGAQMDNVAISDNAAFIAYFNSGEMDVVDVTDPSDMVKISDFQGAELQLVSIIGYSANPLKPTVTVVSYATGEEVMPEGGQIVISSSSQAAYNGPHIVSNSDRTQSFSLEIPVAFIDNPVTKGTSTHLGLNNCVDVVAIGKIVYVLNGTSDARVQIYDATDKGNVKLIGMVVDDRLTTAVSMRISAGLLYVASEQASGSIVAIDIRDNTNPVVVGESTLSRSYRAVTVDSDLVYTCSTSADTLEIWDTSDPAGFQLLSSVVDALRLDRVNDLEVRGGIVFTVDAEGRFSTWNTQTNTSPPALITSIALPTGGGTGPFKITLAGDFAYIANRGANTIEVFDVSDPGTLTSVDQFNIGIVSPTQIVFHGDTAFITMNDTAKLQAWDTRGINMHAACIGQADIDILQVHRHLNVERAATFGGDVNIETRLSIGKTAAVAGRRLYGDPENVVHVEQKSDFPTPSGGFIDLAPNTKYILTNPKPQNGIHVVDLEGDVIRLPDGLGSTGITSTSLGGCILSTNSTGALINSTINFSGFFHFFALFAQAPNGNIFNITGTLPTDFDFFPRVFVTDAGFFNSVGIGSITNISFNQVTSAYFDFVGGAGKGLIFTNTREALIDDTRFTDWDNTIDTNIFTFNGNNDLVRVTGCTFRFGDLVDVFDISPTVPRNNTLLITDNTFEGGKESFRKRSEFPITTIVNASQSGTTTSVVQGPNGASFAMTGTVVDGQIVFMTGHTDTAYNGFFRAVFESGSNFEMVSPITGLFVSFTATDSGTWDTEAIQINTPDTGTMLDLTPVNILGTVEYDGSFGSPIVEDVDGIISGDTFDSPSVADWAVLGITTNDVVIFTTDSNRIFKIKSIAAGNLTLEQSPGDQTDVSFIVIPLLVSSVYDIVLDTSFKIARRFISNETPSNAVWHDSSVDERDERVISNTNNGIPNSIREAAISAQLVTDETVITTINVAVFLNLEAATVTKPNNMDATSGWTLTGVSSGAVRYDVTAPFKGNLIANMTAVSSGGTQTFLFFVVKNGSPVQDANGETLTQAFSIGSAAANVTIQVPITAVIGDQFAVKVQNEDGTSNITISSFTKFIK